MNVDKHPVCSPRLENVAISPGPGLPETPTCPPSLPNAKPFQKRAVRLLQEANGLLPYWSFQVSQDRFHLVVFVPRPNE